MRSDLPTGTVTFLFTDVEGSTRLLHEFGAEGYADALAEHRRVIREACAREGGVEVDTQGDAFFFAFPTAPGAVTAASSMTEALASGPIRVRVGLHTGTPLLADEGYVGDAVHFAARVASSGHGGQVVCSKATADLVELDLTDLGEHRLKDIAEAVPIYQLGDGSFPPLKTISNTNLPRPASSFVGRKQELETVLALIEEGARLLTLTGPGGSGKTRLALEAASTLVPEYKAGVFWVGLAALRDPALVTETIAQTLGSKDGLAEHLGERELLLLLDNLEQVIEVAPELSSLLQGCPNLTLLVTSRELLRVQGELEYEVPPLLEPEAVSLFCVRSQLEPSEEISELCRRLDSLPLAVELAAARTKALSPKQILERLSQRLDLLKGGRDADPRQQTLRATIEWSYDLLSADEQELFARLSVFSGGCTLEAAEQVADADLNTLQSLVEKSLLRFTDERYWMLETIREFAEERVRSGDLAARCDDYFVGVASRANVESSSGQGDWLDRLEEERANLRNSISSSLARNAVESAYQLATAYARLTVMRGPRGDGRHCLTQVLQHQDEASAEARQQALLLASILAERQNDLEAARSYAEESLGLARSGGDPDAVGSTLLSLGIVAGDAGDLERSEALQVEALTMFSEAGNARRVRQTLGMLAFLYIARGDYPRAADVAREALDLSRASGDSWGMTVAAGNLGHAMMRMGHLEEARGLMRDALLGAHAMRDVQAFSETLLDFATLAMSADHRPRDAATLLGAIDGFSESAEFALVSVEIQWFGELREQARGALGEQEFSRAMDAGRRMSMDEVLNLALASRD